MLLPTARSPRLALASLALFALSAAAGTPQDTLSKKEIEKLVEQLVALDTRSADGCAQQDAILAQLTSVPFPRESDLKKWVKQIDKLFSKQRELEKKSGNHYYWDEPRRGRYLIGGKTRKPKGLFLGLHGGGLGSGDAGSSHSAWSNAIEDHDWVGVFPEVLEKTEHGWTTSGTEEWILQLVEDARRTFDIDPQKVFVGGHSMGGFGSWTVGAHHADLFAALTPSAGAPTPIRERPGAPIIDIEEGVVPNLRNIPMVVYQSIDDPQVPPDVNQAAARIVAAAKEKWGGYRDFEYWEVDGRGHGFPPGGTPAILEKVAHHKRNAHPEKIVWQPTLEWKRQFYWLYWQQPALNAIVVAERDPEANSISVNVENGEPAGLGVLLSSAIVDMQREVTISLGGKEVFKGIPEPSFAVFLRTAANNDPQRTYVAWIPLVP